MSNVIKFPQFEDEDDSSGYIIDGREIKGVYHENLSAMKDYDNVYLGIKADDGIDNAILTNVDDMNEFCLMWLLIFNSEVIVEELP